MKEGNTVKKISLAIGLLIAVLLTGCSGKSPYSKEQAMIKDGYERIKDTLLDPESMIIYDSYAWSGQSEEQMDAEAKAKYSGSGTETEFPDDIYVIYYRVGARNKMGGMSEAQYIVIYDLETGKYKASGEKDDVDEAVEAYLDGDKTAVFDRDVQGEFLNVEVWQVMGLPEWVTDAKAFIDSDDFAKVDVQKVLG